MVGIAGKNCEWMKLPTEDKLHGCTRDCIGVRGLVE